MSVSSRCSDGVRFTLVESVSSAAPSGTVVGLSNIWKLMYDRSGLAAVPLAVGLLETCEMDNRE